MDKNTLSNYGWIVICFVVLAVMIALATPFGTYVKDAVWSVTEGLFDVEDAALGAAGVNISSFKVPKNSEYKCADGTIYKAGETLPSDYIPQTTDTLTTPFYIYSFNCRYKNATTFITDETMDGWHVQANSQDRISYPDIYSQIQRKNITDMSCAFAGCVYITASPAIPSTVTTLFGTYQNCKALTSAPEMPDAVTNLNGTFNGCESLETVGDLPVDAQYIQYCFTNCTSLKSVGLIGEKVIQANKTFENCPALEGNIVIKTLDIYNSTDIFTTNTNNPLTVTVPAGGSTYTSLSTIAENYSNITVDTLVDKKVLVFGDSLTADVTYTEKVAWLDYFYENLENYNTTSAVEYNLYGAKEYKGIKYTAYGGTTWDNYLYDPATLPETHNTNPFWNATSNSLDIDGVVDGYTSGNDPDYIICMLGINTRVNKYYYATYGNDETVALNAVNTNAKSFIEQMHTLYPNAKIMLCGYLENDAKQQSFVIKLNEMYKGFATEYSYVSYCDVRPNVNLVTAFDETDTIHPTTEGYKGIANNVWKSFLTMIG